MRSRPATLYKVCFIVAIALVAPRHASAQAEELMLIPVPLRITQPEPGMFTVKGPLTIAYLGIHNSRLTAAVARLDERWHRRTGFKLTSHPADATAQLVIDCVAEGALIPSAHEDETYQLQVSGQQIRLHAPTVTGALRGLATLLQLVEADSSWIRLPRLLIQDEPRFPWRGLMIDVAHRWQPLEVIERNLDAMEEVKLNVLHLHLTDDQGFRVESRTHPELTSQGSDGNYFTQQQIQEIISYATARGIRIVPEFAFPGHATSWLVSHPELGSQPGPYQAQGHWGTFDAVLDPTNEKVYILLKDFLGEMAALFPDEYIELGEDDTDLASWTRNPRLQDFIKSHDLKNNAGLRDYFLQRVREILSRHSKKCISGKTLNIVSAGNTLIADSKTPVTTGSAGISSQMILPAILYIDLTLPPSEYYWTNPFATQLKIDQQNEMLGGEAMFWSQWVTPENIDTRIWPRAAAVAELLWSPKSPISAENLATRLSAVELRLQESGLENGIRTKFEQTDLSPTTATAQAIRILADAIEPVSSARRGELQPTSGPLTALTELADWARPQSDSARQFAQLVYVWIDSGNTDLAPEKSSIQNQLVLWAAAGRTAAAMPANNKASLQARVQAAADLQSLSEIGLTALDYINKKRITKNEAEAFFATINRTSQDNPAAVQFPFLPALRLLVAAASEDQNAYPGSERQWRKHLDTVVAVRTPLGRL